MRSGREQRDNSYGGDHRVAGVVVARYDSSRLPGKVLTLVDGRPLLELVLERAWEVKGIDHLVLATTRRAVDDPLAEFAEEVGLDVYRGPTDDVAGRVLEAADTTDAAFIVRLNGDSPFVDTALLEEAIDIARTERYDLVTNLSPRTYPYGVSAEVVRRAALADAHPEMPADDREHVTRFFYRHPERFSIHNIPAPSPIDTEARLVVDTEEDLDRLRAVAAELGPELLRASCVDIVRAYERVAGEDPA